MPGRAPRSLALLLLGLCLAGACKSSESKSSDSKPSESTLGQEQVLGQTSDPGKTAPTPRQPTFEVDGEEIEVAPLADELELLSIPGLPAVETWSTVIARSQDGREFRGAKPMLLTGVRTMTLVRLEAGYEFRVMDTRETGPYVRHKMPAVRRVLIHTKGYTPPPRAMPELLLSKAGSESILTPEILETIERAPEPNGEEQRDTWLILDVLGLEALGEEQRVVLEGGEQKIVLSPAELADPGYRHMLKRNRRGAFHYRAWKLGEKPSKSGELRGLSRIELR